LIFDIRTNKAEKDLDMLFDIFDNNIYVLTFAIKKYSLKNVRPSYILNYLELKNLDALNDSIQLLLDIDYNEIKKFNEIFIKISHYDDYEIYKIIYDKHNQYEKAIKKEKQIQNEYKHRIKQLEKHMEKNSLF